MIPVHNIKDSYTWYRKNLLKERLKQIQVVNKDIIENIDNYERLPIKKIERLEKEYNIQSQVLDPGQTIYLAIVLGYLKFLVKKVFEGHEVKLGAKLGVIRITGKKVEPRIGYDGKIIGVSPSWAKTKKLWDSDSTAKKKKQLVYCFNEHSDGVRYKIVWLKKNVIVKHKTFYTLQFNRVNRRMLWKLVNEGKEYMVIEK